MTSHDAVVVGAGPNGLVAANHLVDAGWSVLVVEAQDEVGGAVRSDRELHPDFVQDTFSAFYPLSPASAALAPLRLEEHGLAWSHAPAVLGHPLPDGRWAVLHRDREITAGLMDEQHPGDGEAWHELCALWDRIGDPVVAGLTGPFPPVRAGLRMLARLRSAGGLDLVRTLLTPATALGEHRFGGDAAGLLLSGNAGHADIPIGSPGSGLFGLLLTMLGQTVGFPVPVGGAGELSAALRRRLESRGGEVVTGAEVTSILVQDRTARAVLTEHGVRHDARRAVVADVSALRLFNRLLAPGDVPPRVVRGMRSFELDPGTVKVDWALSGPVPWASPPPYAPGTVHVADSVDQMGRALAQVASHTIPADPFLLTGQMTTSDPTRSPAGTESFWAYTHVPQSDAPVTDELGEITGRWDRDDCERFGDRIQARIERLAPGFGSRLVGRRVLGPRELEARDANLIGGSLNGGTAQLHQELVLRPVPALWGRPETGVRRLYLGSASAHPGGGVHGAPGANAARAALLHHRSHLRR
ncbi:phytoene desaturase family protein [Nocardioides rubriscoriae]|uniref:phytoene desaturase family protein n=1 Tax=Nocardioides rubriscoriae TaxID=642762 RepID=UPI0011DFF5AB|nr:NAD(P)/FAD-dependent oxidoreductase [Nocardioides rubriscoriae]